ncbi:carbohydrate-binding protein [Ideonella azotifigens]|uniref:GH36-type glycosyl hydrolase domain-containing protein n=1 Tax=Ideonella azotifigens TaxID=513160 RepID=UPI001E5D0F1A|nr:glucoamylase family protein [Ideonella azotifigens]MCD2339329.1 carbohydrate-binding protein [Ideonella azotifigens]
MKGNPGAADDRQDAADDSSDSSPPSSAPRTLRESAARTGVLNEQTLLSPAMGPLEPAIRSVLFGPARFEQHGQSLAQAHEVVPSQTHGSTFFPRLRENVEALQQARHLLERRAVDGRHLGPAAHWLLDNAALIDEQLHEIRRSLPRNFFRLLPRLRDEPLAGLPRIYGVAWAWVAHTDSGFDTELLKTYLRAYQGERELSLAELWALPTTLRVVLVENLRRLAERAATLQAARDAAHQWLDQQADAINMAQLDALAPQMAARGVGEAFLLQLDQRVEELSPEMSAALNAWLSTRLPDPAGALARQQNEATKDQQSIRNAITTLRFIARANWRELIADASAVMRILQVSPVYAAEAETTQDDTLHAVERLARRSAHHSETDVARLIVELAEGQPDLAAPEAAPAYWWRGPGQARLLAALDLPASRWPPRDSAARRQLNTAAYLAGLMLLTALAITWLLHFATPPALPVALLVVTGLLLLGPVSEAVVALVNRLISESARPARLPRLAFPLGLPASEKVMVVIPVMLTSEAAIAAHAAQLEQHYLANAEPHAQFALLSDFADADAEHSPADGGLLARAQREIERLNARYPRTEGADDGDDDSDTAPPRFLLLHRARRWSETEQRWIGWERKRGKLEALVEQLAWHSSEMPPEGMATSPSPFADLGALSRLAPDTRYVVTLDADTDMPPGRLRRLVGNAAHPLNRPRLDASGRRLLSGYAILQPRVSTPLPNPGTATPYHRLFSGQCGIDPYSIASSEIFQDLFGEGTFSGKGLLHVQAFRSLLAGRLPEGQVLSHDLLEGSVARCAGVSDVTLLEAAPVHPDVAASRLHRWTRGDWQLLPFLRHGSAWGLVSINRWKMLDNLRRSLVAPLSLALLLWVLATGAMPLGMALAVVAAAFCTGPLIGAVAGLAPSRDDIALGLFYRRAGADVLRALALAVWHIGQLLQLAWLYGDAIVRALYRQLVSRRHLLAWTTAAAAEASARTALRPLLLQHWRVPAAALGLGLLLAVAAALGAPVQAGAAAVLLLVWAASPLWTWLAARPLHGHAQQLDEDGRDYLHGVARDTWRYYESHVTASDRHLPPDNVQQTPYQIVAHRTSPTNIGLYLLTVACARELGFIGLAAMTERLQATLDSLDTLPRWRGHFYNWYDTQSGAVLPPAYVSAVDSGNCSGHLLVVAQACEAAAALSDEQAEAPLQVALERARQRMKALHSALANAPSLQTLALLAQQGQAWPTDLAAAQALSAQVRLARMELDTLHLAQQGLGDPDERRSLWLMHDMVVTLESAVRDRLADRDALRSQLRTLAQRARKMGLEADYAALYDRERQLLHIGCRTDTHQLDDNHYDLLASESRLTSLVGIAKGDLPVAHWAALGRPFFACGKEIALKSWSGSMFEYLMPSLVLAEPIGSVLHQATRSAVAEQRAEAREKGTPWGISESAIAGQDHTLAYQYGPQGAPRLALSRLPADERVLAPYATLMATVVAPVAAVENLRALQELGARRTMGFIEAVDYTPRRQTAGSSFTLVHTYMAHHQGMAMLALTNVLADEAPRHWAQADPHLRAVSTLLHERAPREVAALPAALPAPKLRGPRSARMLRDSRPLQEAVPLTQLLTNGRYAVVLRSHGAGYSSWDGVGITRFRDDLLRGAYGSFFYLQREGLPNWQSITAHPAPDPAARYSARLQAERVIFDARWSDLHSSCTVWVSPEDDCEMRQVVLTNASPQAMALTLASCFEATLAPQRGDEAHPAFSNLFIQTRWDESELALHMVRNPRLPDEAAMRAVHFLAGAEGIIESVAPCADRARWLGRYGSSARPLGDGGAQFIPTDPADPQGGAGQLVDTGLDPIAGLLVRLRIAPGASVTLTFCTAAAREADTLSALIDKYRQPSHVERAASMSYTMAGIRLRELQFEPDTWAALLNLNTLVTGQATRTEGAAQRGPVPVAARCDRRALWRHGISGDRPLIWVSISGEEGLELVQTLKRALRMWSTAGLVVDLVVSNDEPVSYLSPVLHALQTLQARLHAQHHGRPSHLCAAMYVLREPELSADERITLHTLSRLRLLADGRSLAQQLSRWAEEQQRAHAERSAVKHAVVPLPLPLAGPVRHAVLAPEGRFDAASGAFVFERSPAQHPSRPWVNVLANPDFGCQVSELAGGYTWAGNSRMHQLTGWSNDALSDPAGEWLLLHDLDRGRIWALGRQLSHESPGEVEHGIGYSRLRQRLDDIEVTLTWCVDPRAAVKQVQVELALVGTGGPAKQTVVASSPRRRLRLVAMAEWQMGSARQERISVATRPDWLATGPEGAGLPQPQRVLTLQATQLDHLGGFGNATAFLAIRPPQPGDEAGDRPGTGIKPDAEQANVRLLPQDWTCDRREFFNTAGQLILPVQLGQDSGAGLDACAALAAQMEIAPAQPAKLTVLLGHGRDPGDARTLLQSAWRVAPAARLAGQREQWREMLGNVQVRTPDARFDALVNHWLPYQTLGCRMWARAGFYQAGGAFGYRDQLQDAMALVTRAPQLLAAQIRTSAARQFPEGDVQHWWHEPGGAGVRTHFSDDRLWLPLALAHYVERTGERALLDEEAPFLQGQPVPAGAEDIYESPTVTPERASLYEHAARAIDCSLANGVHGLPLFGTGDWNDGMNRVGHHGKGESVWLAWFLCQVIADFAPIATARGEAPRARRWLAARDAWVKALDTQAWDGQWYLRGFFDDGSALGSAQNPECRIDLIAQAWAVLTGAGDEAHARQAMASASVHLLDTPNQLVRLLDPPLQHAAPSAGYIQAYPRGVRENGGQYNHAAVWALMALARLGQRERSWQVFCALSPAHRWADPRRGETYAIEPYVMAGDIYTHAPYVGRGGWSWYTGSAGWLLRAAVESICGVVLAGGKAVVSPCLPPHWDKAEVSVRLGERTHRIVVCAHEATVHAELAARPGARRVEAHQAIDLAGAAESSCFVLLAPPGDEATAPAALRTPIAPGAGQAFDNAGANLLHGSVLSSAHTQISPEETP